MERYYIRSEHFVTPGENLETDAVMDAADLHRIKQLAGMIPITEDFYEQGGMDPAMSADASDGGQVSPVGSMPNKTTNEKRQIEREKHIKPGSDEWFRLWFAKESLTGEKPIGDATAPEVPRDKGPLKS